MPTATYSEETQTTAESARSKRSLGEDPVPAPSHTAAAVPRNYRQIPGWGTDLDPANRPSYPKELPSNVTTARGDVPAWQKPTHRIHMSNEHPNLTPVFGTSCPPKALSGLIRDYAYQYGEATNRHWMTLVFADRVDMIETMITDALRGRPDNIVREKGWATLWHYADDETKRRYLMIGGATLGALALGVALSRSRRS